MPFWSKSGEEVTVTFTANGTWVAPASTSIVSTVYGQGGSGSPAIPASYGSGSVQVANMDYLHNPGTTGSTAGNPTWFGFNTSLTNARNTINTQAGTSTAAPIYVGYSGTTFYATGPGTYTNNEFYNGGQVTPNTSVLAGSATQRIVGTSASSGSPVVGGANYSTQGFVDYQYLVPGTGVGATSGSASTAFGFNFPGGVGGAGTPSTQGPTTVTPGASYPIVVGSGGFITITFYQ